MRSLRPTALLAAIAAAALLVCASAPSASQVHFKAAAPVQENPVVPSIGITSAIEPRPHASAVKVVRTAKVEKPAVRAPAPPRTPNPPWTPPPPGGSGGCAHGYIHDLIVSSFSDVSRALYVARRESNCDPSAKNRYSSASGVFQIVRGTWAYWSPRCGFGGASVFSGYANVKVAACMVRLGGWGPWGY